MLIVQLSAGSIQPQIVLHENNIIENWSSKYDFIW